MVSEHWSTIAAVAWAACGEPPPQTTRPITRPEFTTGDAGGRGDEIRTRNNTQTITLRRAGLWPGAPNTRELACWPLRLGTFRT